MIGSRLIEEKAEEKLKYGEFMTALRKGEPRHVYLLAGEEHYYIEKAEERILAGLFPGGASERQDALQSVSGDLDSDELIGLIESAPFFADKNVILLKGSGLFKEKKGSEADKGDKKAKNPAAKKEARLLATLADMPPYSYVIFESAEKADKRRKLYKTIDKAGAVLEAEPIRAWNINDWLQGKLQELNKDLDREAYAYFSGAVSMMQQISLGYLDQEFNKLALYTKERHITKKDLQQVFAGLPEVSAFSMLDAISAHDMRKALQLLRRQTGDGVFLPLILGLLVRHVRQLWQAKVLMQKGYRGKQLAAPLELNPFIAEKLGRASQSFSEAVLKQATLDLADADYYLKTGQAGAEVLENVVICLCRKS